MRKTFDYVKDSYMNYRYVLAYEFSEVKFGETAGTDVNWDECLEAYLIKDDMQLHVYLKDGELVADEFTETDADCKYADHTYIVREGVDLHGKSITVREYLDTDEDGQAYVSYSRIISVD